MGGVKWNIYFINTPLTNPRLPLDVPGKGAYFINGWCPDRSTTLCPISHCHNFLQLISRGTWHLRRRSVTSGVAVKNHPIAADAPGKGAYFACGRRKYQSMTSCSISHGGGW